MKFETITKLALGAGILATSLLGQPHSTHAQSRDTGNGGGDIIVFDIVGVAATNDASDTPTGDVRTTDSVSTDDSGPKYFDGRLLTASDLKDAQQSSTADSRGAADAYFVRNDRTTTNQ